MSLFILQVVLINQFGGDSLFKDIINTITGSVTSIITITVAILILIKSKKTKED